MPTTPLPRATEKAYSHAYRSPTQSSITQTQDELHTDSRLAVACKGDEASDVDNGGGKAVAPLTIIAQSADIEEVDIETLFLHHPRQPTQAGEKHHGALVGSGEAHVMARFVIPAGIEELKLAREFVVPVAEEMVIAEIVVIKEAVWPTARKESAASSEIEGTQGIERQRVLHVGLYALVTR